MLKVQSLEKVWRQKFYDFIKYHKLYKDKSGKNVQRQSFTLHSEWYFIFKQSNKNKMSNTDTNLSIPIFNEWLPMTTFLVRF